MRLLIDWDAPAETLMFQWKRVRKKERERLYKVAQGHIGLCYGALRVGDFFACLRNDFSVIGVCSTWNDCTVYQYIWAMGFVEYGKAFAKLLGRLVPPMTPDERAAQSACVQVSMEEGILVFLRGYFGLPSFSAAEDLTVNELVMAKRDTYNRAVYETKLRKIAEMRNKR